jgi:hypothetical protein
MERKQTRLRVLGAAFAAVLLVVAVPAAGVPSDNTRINPELLEHLSSSVVVNYWTANPDEAPSRYAEFVALARDKHESQGPLQGGGHSNEHDLFNQDVIGFPQNEESITACRTNTNVVLGGTNDYRGLIEPPFSVTGWHYSNNGGKRLTNEGLLPPVTTEGPDPREISSGGDPVDIAVDGSCDLYASSLAYSIDNPFAGENGIAVYKTTPANLESCAGGFDPTCWPTKRLVAEGFVDPASGAGTFLDKEWLYVGRSGGATWVWVTYSEFIVDPEAPLGFSGAEIRAVRCDANLVECSQPIRISDEPPDEPDVDVQFSDVTIGEDGRVYVTWSEIVGELPSDPEFPEQTFIHKIRVAEPGTMTFSPEQDIYAEERAIPFGGFMHANDWRVATYPKNEIALVNGTPRIFLIWDACEFRLLGSICEEAEIKLSWSDHPLGMSGTWTDPIVVSKGGDNYFPTITTDRAGGRTQSISMAWFTNRHDIDFHNTQDVVLTTAKADRPRPTSEKRLTDSSNETEADPLLGGFFIGDYIEAFTHANTVWVHWNGNYRKVPLLGAFVDPDTGEPLFPGVPVNQQDNYLTVTGPG